MSTTLQPSGIRVPLPGDPPVGDRDIQRLAFDLDAAFTVLDAARTSGSHKARASIRQMTSTQSVAKSTNTFINTFDGPDYDNAGMWSTTFHDRLTITVAGLYFIRVYADVATPTQPNPASGASVQIDIVTSGTERARKKNYIVNSSTQSPACFCFFELGLNASIQTRIFWSGTNPAGPLTVANARLGATLLRSA